MPKKGKDIKPHERKTDVFVLGKPKAGKTRMLGTASRHEKLYILDVENGLASIAGANFDYDECHDWASFHKNFNWFMNNYKKEGYTALGIDSISRAQKYLAASLLDRDKTKKLNFDQFAEMLAIIRQMIDVITSNNDFAAIVLCHQELGQDSSIYPCLDGSIKYDITGYFDTVLHCQSGLDKDQKPCYWATLSGTEVSGTRLRHLRNKTVITNDYAELLAPKKGKE